MTISQKKHGNISIRDYASFEKKKFLKRKKYFSFYWKGSRIKMKSEIISKDV